MERLKLSNEYGIYIIHLPHIMCLMHVKNSRIYKNVHVSCTQKRKKKTTFNF